MSNYYLLLSLILALSACAESSKEPNCQVEADVQMIKYPDGQTRKSDIWQCEGLPDGCVIVSFVNDPSLNFYKCEATQ